MATRTEKDLKERGFKLLSLHMYGYRRGMKPDYKVVPVDSDQRKGSPFVWRGPEWIGLVQWDVKTRKWGVHPPKKSDPYSMRVRPVARCATRVEAAHMLVDIRLAQGTGTGTS